MEEFNNMWSLSNGSGLDDSRTTDIMQQIRLDLKNGSLHTRPSSIVSGRFWRNIYQMMSTKHGFMWSCIDILEEASQIPSIRDFLVNRLHFVPLIGDLIVNPTKKIETKCILGLLERLTENYTRTVDEFIFAKLIKKLLQHVNGSDRSQATLSLSILINLCRRNQSAAQHVVHNINMSKFTATLNEFDVLGVRMNLILANFTNMEDGLLVTRQQNIFIMISEQLIEAAKTSNAEVIGYLTNLLREILENSSANQSDDIESLHNNIQPAIDHVVKLLDATMMNKLRSLPMIERIFGLIDALLMVSNKSFVSYYDRIMNTATIVIDEHQDHHASAVALNTIRAAITQEPSVASTFCDKFVTSIKRLLRNLQTGHWEQRTTMFVALFQMLDALLSVVPTTALSVISAESFDGLWTPLNTQQTSPFDLEGDALEMHLYALHLLVRCNILDPENGERTNGVAELLSKMPVHYMLARASNSGVFGNCDKTTEMQRLVFEIARSPYFNTKDICKISTRLHRHLPTKTDDDPNPTFRTSCCALKEPAVARLDQLLHHIQSTIDTNGKTNSSHILELYTHKLLDGDIREKSLQQRLEQALKSVTVLSQDLTMQSLEFDRYNSFVYESATQVERLTVTCDELRREAEVNHKSLQLMNTKLDAKVQKSARDRRDFEQRLAISAAEVTNYKQQIETAQRKADAEVKRFTREAKELQQRYEALVQSIQKYETIVEEHAAEKVRLIAELAAKDAQIKKMENTVLQKQSEIEEGKAIRDQIMSLVGKIAPNK